MGGDDINRQLMFLFTCQLRLENVATELSFSDIFLTALRFAEKLPSVPMLELCCKQSRELLGGLSAFVSTTCISTDCETPCLLSGATCFARCGGIRVSEGWRRVCYPLVGPKQGSCGTDLHSGPPRTEQGQEKTSLASGGCDGW